MEQANLKLLQSEPNKILTNLVLDAYLSKFADVNRFISIPVLSSNLAQPLQPMLKVSPNYNFTKLTLGK